MSESRIFKTRGFARWMRKTDLTDEALCEAVEEMERGLIDADLGGGVVKKRVALPGRGKSRSTRTIVATNRGDLWFFVYGFEKNERDNISALELKALKHLAKDLLSLTPSLLDREKTGEALEEITHVREKKSNH